MRAWRAHLLRTPRVSCGLVFLCPSSFPRGGVDCMRSCSPSIACEVVRRRLRQECQAGLRETVPGRSAGDMSRDFCRNSQQRCLLCVRRPSAFLPHANAFGVVLPCVRLRRECVLLTLRFAFRPPALGDRFCRFSACAHASLGRSMGRSIGFGLLAACSGHNAS